MWCHVRVCSGDPEIGGHAGSPQNPSKPLVCGARRGRKCRGDFQDCHGQHRQHSHSRQAQTGLKNQFNSPVDRAKTGLKNQFNSPVDRVKTGLKIQFNSPVVRAKTGLKNQFNSPSC